MLAIDQVSFPQISRPKEGGVGLWLEKNIKEKLQITEQKKTVDRTQEETKRVISRVVHSPIHPIPLSPEAAKIKQMEGIYGTPESVFKRTTALYKQAARLYSNEDEKERGRKFDLAA